MTRDDIASIAKLHVASPPDYHPYPVCVVCDDIDQHFPCATRKLADEGLAGEQAPAEVAALDVGLEVVQWFHDWFHDWETQCESHDDEPTTCAIMGDYFLRAFVVTPRLIEGPDGTFRFDHEHFNRLHRADLAAKVKETP